MGRPSRSRSGGGAVGSVRRQRSASGGVDLTWVDILHWHDQAPAQMSGTASTTSPRHRVRSGLGRPNCGDAASDRLRWHGPRSGQDLVAHEQTSLTTDNGDRTSDYGAELSLPRSWLPSVGATSQVQVERPQRSEDERPGGSRNICPLTSKFVFASAEGVRGRVSAT